MSPAHPEHRVHPEESWPSWEARAATALTELAGGGFVTYTVAPGTPSEVGDSTGPPRRGWRRRFARGREPAPAGSTASVPTTEVLLQARVIEGVLALECIGDTEFEGLTDLTPAQQRLLVDLGWEQDGSEPTFSVTFAPAETTVAAGLLAHSLREVLGARTPSQVDARRS